MKNKFDSKEELYFSWYLMELQKNGYIESWARFEEVSDSYNLTEGLIWEYIKPMKRVADKELEQIILSPSAYTPDFKIFWTPKALGIFVSDLNSARSTEKIETEFICQDLISIIEVKGTFDMGNMTRLAINNIKFVYYKFGVYVNMIKVPAIFNKSFTPNRYLLTDKTLKIRTIKYKNVRTIQQFINKLQ